MLKMTESEVCRARVERMNVETPQSEEIERV